MLKRAVKSVLKQTFTNWELVIVDDHSNDDKTQKICERFVNKDSRIRYIRHKFNTGNHPSGKNTGTKAAQADLIAYLDDDNLFRKDHLQVLYKYLGENDIIYGDRWMIDETGWMIKRGIRKGGAIGIAMDFNALILQKANYIDTSDVLIRKKCVEKVGGWDESLKKFADWNLWVRCAKAGFKFQRVPLIITNYYVHKGCNQFKHQSGTDPLTGKPMPTFSPDACKIWADKTSFGKRAPLKVAIFTLTMDRLEYTKQMYKTMSEKAGYPFDWFVVDNGSKDGTIDWLYNNSVFCKIEDNKWVKPINEKSLKDQIRMACMANKENVGISKASNQALDMVDTLDDNYDLIIKVDNDCEFMTDDWLKTIVDLYERQQQMVVAPRVEGLRDSPGGVPRERYFYVGKHFLGMAPHLGGICVVAPSKIYKNFKWEEDDFLHGDQDYIFSQHVVSERHLLCYMENIIVEHADTTSFQEKKYPEYEANKKILKTTKYQPVK